MKLSPVQAAALTGALSHPKHALSATPETTAELQLRGLVIGRLLSPRGVDVALSLDTAHLICDECGSCFPAIRSMATDARELCHECIRAIGLAVKGGKTPKIQRDEYVRKGNAMTEMNRVGAFTRRGRFER